METGDRHPKGSRQARWAQSGGQVGCGGWKGAQPVPEQWAGGAMGGPSVVWPLFWLMRGWVGRGTRRQGLGHLGGEGDFAELGSQAGQAMPRAPDDP